MGGPGSDEDSRPEFVLQLSERSGGLAPEARYRASSRQLAAARPSSLPDMASNRSGLVLLTGATGYVGGRLLHVLESLDIPVRCVARRPEFLEPKVDPRKTDVVEGDVLDRTQVLDAMEGVETAYYLIHSMGTSGSFEQEEYQGAVNFAEAARTQGVRRIIYLGGLAQGNDLSPHLSSRQEVGRILRESGVPTIEFQASIILGSGSLSFEMIRSLVKRLPIMITPRWVEQMAQPIAIEDVIAYLVEALNQPPSIQGVFEIGGAKAVSYGDIMREYARQRGLKRIMIKVPVLSPRLSSLWLGLVTPLYARVGRKLIDSVKNETVVRDDRARRTFDVKPLGLKRAIERALNSEDQEFAETRWSDALSSSGSVRQWGGVRFGSRIVDSRTSKTSVAPAEAFRPIRELGGELGWYYADWLWHVRGFLDLLVGGPGMRRGRRDAERLLPGDTLDFWRVEAVEEPKLLRLYAEMKLPGRAWLQFEVEPDGDGSVIRQTAIFDPVGLAGIFYWYALHPIHSLVFHGMLNGIRNAAEANPNRGAAAVSSRG